MAELGWYPDPSGRHEQRFFDGRQWSDHVVDAGVTGLDPLPLSPPATTSPQVVIDTTRPLPVVPNSAQARRPWYRRKRWWAAGAAVVVIGAAAAGGGSDDKPKSDTPIEVVATTVAGSTSVAENTMTTVEVTTSAAPPTFAAVPTAAPAPQAPTPTQPPQTTPPATQPPSTDPPAATQPAGTVHPGAFCSPPGATGVTEDGTPMICSTTSADGVPYGEGKARWRRA
jgi:hypothetical protein